MPCIIVSPWTAGGWVCSQPFDHTSVLQFLEKFTGVAEPNISDWRRKTFGDLTAAFRFEAESSTRRTSRHGQRPQPRSLRGGLPAQADAARCVTATADARTRRAEARPTGSALNVLTTVDSVDRLAAAVLYGLALPFRRVGHSRVASGGPSIRHSIFPRPSSTPRRRVGVLRRDVLGLTDVLCQVVKLLFSRYRTRRRRLWGPPRATARVIFHSPLRTAIWSPNRQKRTSCGASVAVPLEKRQQVDAVELLLRLSGDAGGGQRRRVDVERDHGPIVDLAGRARGPSIGS